MTMKIKNEAARVISLGRMLMMKPGEVHEISETTYQQLRRDPIVRALIADGDLKTEPRDLFNLNEDPALLSPVAMPPRRIGGLTDVRFSVKQVSASRKLNDDDFQEDLNTVEAIVASTKVVDEDVVTPIDPVDAFVGMVESAQLSFIASCEDVELLALIFQRSKTSKDLIPAKVIEAVKVRGSSLTDPAAKK